MTDALPHTDQWFLYMVETAEGRLYTGISKDVERRFIEHSEGKKGARALRGKGPLLLRFQERVGTHSQALKLEYAVKKLKREKKLHIISGDIALMDIIE